MNSDTWRCSRSCSKLPVGYKGTLKHVSGLFTMSTFWMSVCLMIMVCAEAHIAQKNKRPNVLHVVFDDFRTDLPFYGQSEIHAPYLTSTRYILQNKYVYLNRWSFPTQRLTHIVFLFWWINPGLAEKSLVFDRAYCEWRWMRYFWFPTQNSIHIWLCMCKNTKG